MAHRVELGRRASSPPTPTDIVFLVNSDTVDQVATLASSVTVDDLTISGNTNAMTLSIGQGQVVDVGDLAIAAWAESPLNLRRVLQENSTPRAQQLSPVTLSPEHTRRHARRHRHV